MKRSMLLLIGFLMLAGNSLGQTTVFFEGFDGTWTTPPTLSPAWSGTTSTELEWHKNDYTTGWIYGAEGSYSPTGASSTTGSARFHSYWIDNGISSDFITPAIDLSAYTSGINYLEFYHINATGSDILDVYLSTDNGSTWGSALITCNTASAWTLHTAIVLGTTSSNVKLKFTGTSDFGEDDIGLDQVRVYNFLPSEATLTVIPNILAFGYSPSGTPTGAQSYILAGVSLTTGPIVVTASTGFEVSLDNSTWSASVNVTYTPPTLTNTTVYARFYPTGPITFYNGTITNAGGSASVNVTVSGNSVFIPSYCASTAASIKDEEIFSVTVAGNTNAFDCSTVAPGTGSMLNRYSNFAPLGSLCDLQQGTSVAFTILEDECDGEEYFLNGCAIWIDFNLDGDFLDDGEQVYSEDVITSSPRTISGDLDVPPEASLGLTTMRIIVAEDLFGMSLTPCDSYNWGETEDYLVSVIPNCLVANQWNGTISSDWNDPRNWACGFVPDQNVTVFIPTSPSGGRFPVIASGFTADCFEVTLQSGANILIETGGVLNVKNQ